MKIAEVLAFTGANKRSVYRWMERHPTIDVKDEHSLLGHPFPKPVGKEGREVVWDDDVIHAWWNDNSKTVGRHPADSPTTTMPWTSFRKVMLAEPTSGFDEETGCQVYLDDDMELVQTFERQGDQVRLSFRSVSEAVYFKLRHY